jgi:colanic acid/amylovoran biosynthesis glycosyltransferase
MMLSGRRPRVAVWRYRWLPAGETFVRNHVTSLRRWEAVPFGGKRVESPLASPDEAILYGPRERFSRGLFDVTGWSRRVQRFLADGDFDLVHAHFGRDAVLIAPICRRLGLPLVVTLHGQDVNSDVRRGGLRGMRYRQRLRRTLRQASAVLAVSDEIADRARAFGCHHVRTHVLGVPLPGWVEPDAAPDWDIVFAGRLVGKKGAFDLVQALARLQEEGLAPRTAIAGDGPLAGDLAGFAAATGVPVEFLGFRRPDEIRELMSRSALVAVPSKQAADGDREGLPTVVMEAAAIGRPVVGYRHSGIAQAVQQGTTGLLAAEGDIGSLTRHLRDLLRDPGRRARMGTAARRKAEKEFDITTQTTALEGIYDEVMRKDAACRSC